MIDMFFASIVLFFGLFRHDWDFCNFLPAILFVIFETCNDDAVN